MCKYESVLYIVIYMGKPDNRVHKHEESPGSKGRGCQITSGVGNYRESATETFRRNELCRGKVEMVR